MTSPLWVNIVFLVIKFFVYLFDIITFPVWYLLQRPWRAISLMNRNLSIQISSNKEEVTFRSVEKKTKLCQEAQENGIDTLEKMFTYIKEKFKQRPCIGTREIISIDEEPSLDGTKMWKKFNLGEYHWLTYEQMFQKAVSFGRGINSLGYPPKTHIVIYADTKANWLIAAHGCFKFNYVLCTVYTNLGPDGVKHGISETEAPIVIVTQELLPKLIKVLPSIQNVQTVIIMEEPWIGKLNLENEELQKLKTLTFQEVIHLGDRSNEKPTPPSKDDTAIIMYTSGSTGTPKGVVQTHFQITSSLFNVINYWEPMNKYLKGPQTFIAFLPLAHVLEFLGENACLFLGISIGYSNPNTLLDSSTMIKRGCKGDISILRPTLMAAVPLIIDRIYKSVLSTVEKTGPFSSKLFQFCVEYRLRWNEIGMDSPLINRIIFHRVQRMVGGNLKYIGVGSAPLAPVAQRFVRTVLDVKICQGYGLTETLCTATGQGIHDVKTGNVGPPLVGIDIRLRSWEEGGYRVDDKCGPRGEILVGGHHIAKEYFNMPEKTKEEFFNDSNGIRWFKTGDIGQFSKNGSLMIIDRKKDLVKPQGGEYISLGKVEGVLKLNENVESICVVVRSDQVFATAIIVPDKNNLVTFAESVLRKQGFTVDQLCNDNAVKTAFCKRLMEFGLSNGLQKFEIPKKVTLVLDEWTPDTGLVTAAMKLKRKEVEKFYNDQITQMYTTEKSSVKYCNERKK